MITSRRTKSVLIDLALSCMLVATAVKSGVALKKYKPCVTPPGKPGRCVHFWECQALIEKFRNPAPQDDHEEFWEGSICGHTDGSPMVCCAVLLPHPPSCGRNASEPQFGVQATRIGEFPWTALIEYERSNGHFGYHCAGTLINQRYVLTAANCVSDIPRCWKVHGVRLGEWDFSTSDACYSGNSASWPIDIGIEQIVVHSEYNRWDERQPNDIALVRLASDIQYTAHIQPVCLPFEKTTTLVAHTVGWGITAKGVATHEKMMTHLTVLNKEEFLSVYKCSHITSGQMCARAVRAVHQTGTCDPGGQLLRYHDNEYYLIGVGSYGLENCGTGDSPVVFTKVDEYIDWIENTIY
ncbi:CLIP domain-containing serine protease 14D-like [Anopheles albimanus]|uniref:CLIP domain-containing serine protease n=1 Tax=Anopheles albimanus TaxID=7167 RepID=A0A182F3A8_ANOAL|nr:CLIP domain-containing serine protease 14D-like [Anopheles albimanus]